LFSTQVNNIYDGKPGACAMDAKLVTMANSAPSAKPNESKFAE
jgi:hypothetical protein